MKSGYKIEAPKKHSQGKVFRAITDVYRDGVKPTSHQGIQHKIKQTVTLELGRFMTSDQLL